MPNKNCEPKYATFEDWIAGASIYVGYARYGHLGGHGFVIASCYDESEELENAIQDLDAGDNDAFAARDIIEEMNCWYANDPDPAVAMQKLMGKMREYQRCVDDKFHKGGI